jgi:hypothetical protein
MTPKKTIFVAVALAASAIPAAAFADASASGQSVSSVTTAGVQTATANGAATGTGVFQVTASTPNLTVSATSPTAATPGFFNAGPIIPTGITIWFNSVGSWLNNLIFPGLTK